MEGSITLDESCEDSTSSTSQRICGFGGRRQGFNSFKYQQPIMMSSDQPDPTMSKSMCGYRDFKPQDSPHMPSHSTSANNNNSRVFHPELPRDNLTARSEQTVLPGSETERGLFPAMSHAQNSTASNQYDRHLWPIRPPYAPPSSANSKSANNTLRAVPQYPRLSIHEMLNQDFDAAVESARNLPINQDEPANGNDGSLRSSRSSNPPPHSSISTSHTFRADPGIAEKRYDFCNALYHICLNASKSYLETILPACQYHRQRQRCERHHPYARTTGPSSQNQAPTLMANLSIICSYLWRRARSNIMAPHRAEAGALKRMGDLYTWGETVVRGIDGDELGRVGSDEGASLDNPEHIAAIDYTKYGQAAKSLCVWMNNREAWSQCQELMVELQDLDVEGTQRGSDGGESRAV